GPMIRGCREISIARSAWSPLSGQRASIKSGITLSDRILMGPGPSNPYPEVVAAFTRPMLGHLDPEFLSLLDETCERLRAVFHTENALTFPLSGTVPAGMEATLVNVLGPGAT